MEYTRQIDWKINNNIKIELVKRYFNVNKLKITCTKGNVEIKGELEVGTKRSGDANKNVEVSEVLNVLKSADLAMRAIPYVRDIKWELKEWKKVGSRWAATGE